MVLKTRAWLFHHSKKIEAAFVLLFVCRWCRDAFHLRDNPKEPISTRHFLHLFRLPTNRVPRKARLKPDLSLSTIMLHRRKSGQQSISLRTNRYTMQKVQDLNYWLHSQRKCGWTCKQPASLENAASRVAAS